MHFSAARRVLERHPRAVVYLASNDASVKKRAEAEFASRELVYADWGATRRGTVDGARAALADWYALGEAAVVLHTFGSSFGEEAAARTAAPSVRLKRGGHVLGADANRPHCALPLFENADAPQSGDDACFSEAGGARTCAKPLEKARCAPFEQAWGLTNVFC